ncbi:MAG: ferrochelatase [Acidimicrobiales bacterium]
MGTYDALVLVSFGGPERAEDVMAFLRRVAEGRAVPEGRLREVAAHYYAAGGKSPINDQCRALLRALRLELSGLQLGLYWGNRNWHPLLADTLATMRDDGVRRAAAFVTSAYGGYSGCRQYLEDIEAARAAVGPRAPVVDKLRLYYNHPGWVEPWAASLRHALAQAGNTKDGEREVLFSAHSVPLAMPEARLYADQVHETARLVAERAGLGPSQWKLVWQSRSGPPSAQWLGPDIRDVVRASSASAFVVVPVGFVSEHMEVIYDLDIEVAAIASGAGASYTRASTVSADPAFVAMVHQLLQEREDPTAPRLSLGPSGPWPPTCPKGHCTSAPTGPA